MIELSERKNGDSRTQQATSAGADRITVVEDLVHQKLALTTRKRERGDRRHIRGTVGRKTGKSFEITVSSYDSDMQ